MAFQLSPLGYALAAGACTVVAMKVVGRVFQSLTLDPSEELAKLNRERVELEEWSRLKLERQCANIK